MAFAASEVDQIEAADANVRLAVGAELRTLDRHDKNGMRSTRVLVHVGLAASERVAAPTRLPLHAPDRTILVANFDDIFDLLNRLGDKRSQTFDEDARVRPLKVGRVR